MSKVTPDELWIITQRVIEDRIEYWMAYVYAASMAEAGRGGSAVDVHGIEDNLILTIRDKLRSEGFLCDTEGSTLFVSWFRADPPTQ